LNFYLNPETLSSIKRSAKCEECAGFERLKGGNKVKVWGSGYGWSNDQMPNRLEHKRDGIIGNNKNKVTEVH
jgi:hypothetical protein